MKKGKKVKVDPLVASFHRDVFRLEQQLALRELEIGSLKARLVREEELRGRWRSVARELLAMQEGGRDE